MVFFDSKLANECNWLAVPNSAFVLELTLDFGFIINSHFIVCTQINFEMNTFEMIDGCFLVSAQKEPNKV